MSKVSINITLATPDGPPLPIGTVTSSIPGNLILSAGGGYVLPLPHVLCLPGGKLLAL
jgi:hypothetical protein